MTQEMAKVGRPSKPDRSQVTTTLDKDLYRDIKYLAVVLGVNSNDLIERGMKKVLNEYQNLFSSTFNEAKKIV